MFWRGVSACFGSHKHPLPIVPRSPSTGFGLARLFLSSTSVLSLFRANSSSSDNLSLSFSTSGTDSFSTIAASSSAIFSVTASETRVESAFSSSIPKSIFTSGVITVVVFLSIGGSIPSNLRILARGDRDAGRPAALPCWRRGWGRDFGSIIALCGFGGERHHILVDIRSSPATRPGSSIAAIRLISPASAMAAAYAVKGTCAVCIDFIIGLVKGLGLRGFALKSREKVRPSRGFGVDRRGRGREALRAGLRSRGDVRSIGIGIAGLSNPARAFS
mmetsp:Transcript_16313/g.25847  ORF Transcript_16313/g.25847 Transcript_16313/m.25847 type:complete len:275 (+) Transcript_16313:1164-1988(+)